MAICEDWATQADMCGVCNDYSLDAGLLERSLTSASETLYVLSGSQFPGECDVIIRPCNATASSGWQSSNLYSFAGGSITTWGSCSCRSYDSCSCPPLSELRLPHDNVSAITSVKVDGATLATSLYRLDPPNLLVSRGDPWPCCQDIELADTQADTWSVTYVHGLAPPTLGVTAAADLACEFYMACDPDAFEGECRLPSNIISVARQGVTVAKLVGELFVKKPGQQVRFGIPSIDIFLATWGNGGSVIVSPDDPPVARIVGA